MSEQESTFAQLQQIPSIGKSCAMDLWKIGIRNVGDLKNKNPKNLYEKLNYITGHRHDICMLYTFRCAVYYASVKQHNPEKLKWWYWKDKKFRE